MEEDRRVFAGTRLLTGETRVRIAFTGAESLLGEIIRSATRGTHEMMPLLAAFGKQVRFLIVAALFECLALAAVRYSQGHGWLDGQIRVVTIATAAIAEESSVVFIRFFLGVDLHSMARPRALVCCAVTVEDFGRVTYICSDKTKAITEERLRLEHRFPGEPLDEAR